MVLSRVMPATGAAGLLFLSGRAVSQPRERHALSAYRSPRASTRRRICK